MNAIASVPVHGDSLAPDLLGGDPGLVACLAELLGDPVDRVVRGDVDPVVAAGSAIAGHLVSQGGGVSGEHREALGAEGPPVHDMIVVPFGPQLCGPKSRSAPRGSSGGPPPRPRSACSSAPNRPRHRSSW